MLINSKNIGGGRGSQLNSTNLHPRCRLIIFLVMNEVALFLVSDMSRL